MSSILKVDNIQDQGGGNIINESGNTVTIGKSGDTVNIVGTLQNNGGALPGDITSVVAGTGLSGGGTTGAVTINIEAAQPTITSLGTLTGLTTTGNINFGDSDKAIFGAGSDLQINHDGSNSYIEELGTGNLFVNTNGAKVAIISNSDTSGGKMAEFNADSSVELYHNGSLKLATASTGVDVTGDLTATGNISSGNNGSIFLLDSAGQRAGQLVTDSSTANALEIDADPDNSASGSYTAFRIDNSEKMRIPSGGGLLVGKTSSGIATAGFEVFAGGDFQATKSGSTIAQLNRLTNDGDVLRIKKDGTTKHVFTTTALGVNQSSPGEALDVVGNAKITSSANHPNLHIRSTITPNGSKTGGQLNLSLGTGSNSGSGNTSTQVGDILGQINFNGQGTDFSFQGGSIIVKQTTPNGQTNRNDAGCDMIFSVIPAGNTGYQEKLRIKSTGGITFNGDTSVNNALDDYEQGTFTPTFSSGISSVGYNNQSGRYTKVGDIVYFDLNIQTNAGTGASARLKIGGFPFTADTSGSGHASIGYTDNALVNSTSTNLPTLFREPSALDFYNTAGGQYVGTDLNDPDSINIYISGVYKVA